jgi:hypothetical protein
MILHHHFQENIAYFIGSCEGTQLCNKNFSYVSVTDFKKNVTIINKFDNTYLLILVNGKP